MLQAVLQALGRRANIFHRFVESEIGTEDPTSSAILGSIPEFLPGCVCTSALPTPLGKNMSRFMVPSSRYETDEERWDRRQQEYLFPTEHDGRHNPEALDRFTGGSAAWERQGYRDDPDKFRGQYRKAVINNAVKHEYADPNADVGHIFSHANGGANDSANVYMQESGFNRGIKEHHDELNAAMVGYDRTAKAMDSSRKYGHNFDQGRYAAVSK